MQTRPSADNKNSEVLFGGLLVSSWPRPVWCGPVLFSYSSSTRLPDLTSLRWRLMTPPWLTAAGIEGQRRSFIIRWQVPFSAAAGPATDHMPFLFCFVSPFLNPTPHPQPPLSFFNVSWRQCLNNSPRFKTHSLERAWHENKKINPARVPGRYLLTLRHSALIWIGKLRASAGRHLQSIIHYNLPITPTLGIITARALMIHSFICRVVPSGLHS